MCRFIPAYTKMIQVQIVLRIALKLNSLGSDGCNCPKDCPAANINGFTIFQNSDRKLLQFEYHELWTTRLLALE